MTKCFTLLIVVATAGCSAPQPAVPHAKPNRAAAALSIQHAILVHKQDQADGGGGEAYKVGVCTNCGGDGEIGDTAVKYSCGVCKGDGHIDQSDLDRLSGEGYAIETPPQSPPGAAAENEPAPPAVVVPKYRPLAKGERACWYSDLMAAKRDAIALRRPCLIHFSLGANCEPCEAWRESCRDDPRVAVVVNDLIVACELLIDANDPVLVGLAASYGVREYPADVAIAADWSHVIARYPAATDPDRYLSQLEGVMSEEEKPSDDTQQKPAREQDETNVKSGGPAEAEKAPSDHAVLNASIINAGIINARRVAIEGGGGKATIAASDHGVRIDLESNVNKANVMIYLDPREGGVISLRHDDEQGPHVFALQLPNSGEQTDPMLQISDIRDRTKVVRFSMMEFAETLRSQARFCDTTEV